MTQFTSLIREIMPAWLRRRSRPNVHETDPDFDPSRPGDADMVWRGIVERDLFGANTQDYAENQDKNTNRH
ncbi:MULTISPECIES: hypothetical protein [unclassified Mesorhizobium]|uniref:hypothetical protein n=1 Tax=unclassified Mesorhizobium TaxID=325217 RepID=UPI00112CEE46|nr:MULTISPECIES: hypothetical protein [unclassified Mesorhizobium]TPM96492.1 hypothetical protein FJ977_17955 [Mesorhizobium sp. B2-1-3A]BCG88163.1 hypothetical protein MesoLj113c_42730 [Mesorhizobium sp. 113-3-9]